MDESNFSEVELTDKNTSNPIPESPLPPDYVTKLEQFVDKQDFIQIREDDEIEDDVPFDPNLLIDAVYDWETDLPLSDKLKQQ